MGWSAVWCSTEAIMHLSAKAIANPLIEGVRKLYLYCICDQNKWPYIWVCCYLAIYHCDPPNDGVTLPPCVLCYYLWEDGMICSTARKTTFAVCEWSGFGWGLTPTPHIHTPKMSYGNSDHLIFYSCGGYRTSDNPHFYHTTFLYSVAIGLACPKIVQTFEKTILRKKCTAGQYIQVFWLVRGELC